MKIATQSVENSQAVLQIEVEPGEMEESLDRAYRQLVKRVGVPGFRKGKAPRSVLERYVGKEGLQREALEDLVPELCTRVIEEQKMEVIAQPQIEIIQSDPVIFKAIFPLRPHVELGDYHTIRVDKQPVEVGDEEINSVIHQLRERHAVWSPVERPVNFEDLVVVDIDEEAKDGTVKTYQARQFPLVKDSLIPLPGFAEHLVGMTTGGVKEFALTYPDDYKLKELAGRDTKFKVKLIEVKEKHLPELDDDFAKSLVQGMENLEALRNFVAANLRKAAEEAAKRDYERKLVEAVVGLSKVDFPPVLVDREIDSLLKERDFIFREQGGLQGYLKNLNKTEQGMKEELRPEAVRRITESLVLGKIIEQEKITVDDAEIAAEIESMTKDAGDRVEEMQRMLGTDQARQVVEERQLSLKALQKLTEIALNNVAEGPEKTA